TVPGDTPPVIEPPATEPTTPPALGLGLAFREGAVRIDFTACTVDGADAYKVVRSSDETVTWPAGSGDTLIAAIAMGGSTLASDEHAPAGKKVWYRVFCVRHTDAGYKVLQSSPARAITTPAAPPPEPTSIGIDVSAEGGIVTVHWDTCNRDAFSHYRILRKIGDATTVVAEIASVGTTTWVDDSVEAGGTYAYLVQAKGKIDGAYVSLCSSS